MAIVISCCNMKGGCGKTTSTIELAACFRQLDYKVLAVDLDQQANLTEYTSADPFVKGIYDVLSDDIPCSSVIQHTEEFDVLAGSDKLSKADKTFSDPLDVLKLKKVLKSVSDDYDFILIDNNPARNVLLNMSYIASDFVIIPAEAEEGSLKGIRSVYDDLKKFRQAEWTNADVVCVILSKFERTGMHKYMLEKIQECIAAEDSTAQVFTVRKSIAANECKTEGTSMQIGKHNSKPAEDYRHIADELIKKFTEE